MTFTLTEQEAKAILQVLGQMPTSNGVYPLFIKLGKQYQENNQPVNAETETNPQISN